MPLVRITGPYAGRFIAAHALRGDGGWAGEARVFPWRPTRFDDDGAVADILGSWVNAPSELDALESAERVARDVIAQWARDEAEDASQPDG